MTITSIKPQRVRAFTPKTFLEREFPSGKGAKGITITPAIARELLENNPDNRGIKDRKVASYASDMAAGRWALNGESIIIANDGAVNDGQHRLWACVEADNPFNTVIVYGVERDTRLTVDQGAARTASDYLGMESCPNSTHIASIARLVLTYNKTGKINRTDMVTNAEILEFVAKHGDELQDIHQQTAIAPPSLKQLVSRSVMGVAVYVLRDQGNVAMQYLTQVMTGEELKQGDPAYSVRERLSSIAKGNRNSRLEAIMRGWIYHRDGKQLKIVRITGELPTI